MIAGARSLALMLLAPPLVLLLWAHVLRPVLSGSGYAAGFVAALVGLAGVAIAPASNKVKALIAVCYVSLCFVTLPFVTLLAVCSTGDCL